MRMPAVIFTAGFNDGVDMIPIPESLTKGFDHHTPHAFPTNITIRIGIERGASGVWRKNTHTLGSIRNRRINKKAHRPHKSEGTLPIFKRLKGSVKGGQCTGAGCIDGLAWSSKIKEIGNPVSQHGVCITCSSVSMGALACILKQGLVIRKLNTRKHTHIL